MADLFTRQKWLLLLKNGGAQAPTTLKVGASGGTLTSIRFGTTAALVGGTAAMADTGATASSKYFFSVHPGGLGTVTVPSAYYASVVTPGTGFTIVSNQATDTSTVDWMAIN
jgi:hypothetical protein